MPENSIVKTVKLVYRADFEQNTSEMIKNGYKMISCGYVMKTKETNEYWWAVLVKEEKAGVHE